VYNAYPGQPVVQPDAHFAAKILRKIRALQPGNFGKLGERQIVREVFENECLDARKSVVVTESIRI